MIKEEDVEKAARLAKIHLTAPERRRLLGELEGAIQYFEKIQSVNTDHVEPLFSPVQEAVGTRLDEVVAFRDIDLVLDQAPETAGRLFKVPPVV